MSKRVPVGRQAAVMVTPEIRGLRHPDGYSHTRGTPAPPVNADPSADQPLRQPASFSTSKAPVLDAAWSQVRGSCAFAGATADQALQDMITQDRGYSNLL